MSRIAQQGRRSTGNRAFGRRIGRTGAAAGALATALALTLGPAPQALAQSSGIYINNDVLNSLGPGPGAAPVAPLAPAAPAASPLQPLQPFAPQPHNGNNLTFQTYGSGNYVVTRPGTLLFPPLEPPASTLAPGITDNHAARTEAMSNAFAAGPEPSSQLLIPLERDSTGDGSVIVFMDNLPPADTAAEPGSAPVLTLRRPALATPEPAPRKPEVSAEMLAETGATAIDDPTAGLAPEFQAPEAEAAPETTDEAAAPQPAETAPVEVMPVEVTPVETAPAAAAAADTARVTVPAPAPVEAAPKAAAPEAAETAPTAPMAAAPVAAAPSGPAKAEAAGTAVAAQSSDSTATNAPVSLVPASGTEAATSMAAADTPLPSAAVQAPVTQTAALPQPAAVETPTASTVTDMSFLFENDSAELSTAAQNELRGLAQAMRERAHGRIQVLGFASADSGSDDLARRLALSRALKVRTFLIDAGVPSARIQVRSLGAQSDGGPANRVDIRPIDS